MSLKDGVVPKSAHVIPGMVFDTFDDGGDDYAAVFPATQGHRLYGRAKGDLCATGVSLVDVVTANDFNQIDRQAAAKVGRRTGLIFGRVCVPGLVTAEPLPWPYTVAGPEERRLRVQQVAVEPWVRGGTFCEGGDSGSLVWTATGRADVKAIGILHSKLPIDGVGTLGVLTPAYIVQEEYSVMFVTGAVVECRELEE